MTAPQDPFAAPDSGSVPQQGYGQPPTQGQTPAYGSPPPFGQPDPSLTPYGQAPATGWQGPPLASWGRRAAGYLIDFVISLIAQVVIGLIEPTLGTVTGFAVFLYFGYLTGTSGQTPGRSLLGIKVLREADGQPLGAGAGIGRGFLHIVDALPLLLGFFWPIWDAKKQTFADKIIKSVVIKL